MYNAFPRAFLRLLLGAAFAFAPLSHAIAQSECKYTPISKLPLRYSGPRLVITTQGSINGTPAELMVDTGTSATKLTRTGTERRGIRLYATGNYARGRGGALPIYVSTVNEFIVGPVRAGRSSMPVVLSMYNTPSHDAIIGASALLQADMEISLAEKHLLFFAPKKCASTHLAYWSKDALGVPMRRHDIDNMNPKFLVRINGVELEAAIDTGSAVSTMSIDAAKRSGIALDGPNVTRSGDIVGAGSYSTSLLIAKARFQIGEETVENAQIGIENPRWNGADVTLGADFLRAHRVLFATSQNKLYFSYIGGEPFRERHKIEPWMIAEAEAGNADAQLAISRAYRRGEFGVPDKNKASDWLEKAAISGSADANLSTGVQLLANRDYAIAAVRLRYALDRLPAERDGALWLYLARVRVGQADLAKSELDAIFARTESGEWPKPIGEFYLGKLSAEKLLAEASGGRSDGKERLCEALAAMGDFHRAHRQPEKEQAIETQIKASCTTPELTYRKLGG